MKDKINNGSFENGSVNISEDVISIISGIAASEVEGVAKMSGGITGEISEMLGMKNLAKGVDVSIEEEIIKIDMYIAVEYGYKIRELAKKVQMNVKETVESMTGLDVEAVNVNVSEVVFPKKETKELEKNEM